MVILITIHGPFIPGVCSSLSWIGCSASVTLKITLLLFLIQMICLNMRLALAWNCIFSSLCRPRLSSTFSWLIRVLALHLFINEKSKLSLLLVIMEVALQNISFLSISDVGTTLIPMPPCFVQVSVSKSLRSHCSRLRLLSHMSLQFLPVMAPVMCARVWCWSKDCLLLTGVTCYDIL
jgi:hypothetical protein